MTKLEKLRDELAAHLQLTNKFHEAMGYNHSKAFKDGFNTSSDYWRKQTEGLLEALELVVDRYDKHKSDQFGVPLGVYSSAKQALEKFRKEME